MGRDRKPCGQVTIPMVDNSSPCDEFTYEPCVLIDRKSVLVGNIPGEDLEQYHIKLEAIISKLRNTVKILENKVEILQNCCNQSTGIGNFD